MVASCRKSFARAGALQGFNHGAKPEKPSMPWSESPNQVLREYKEERRRSSGESGKEKRALRKMRFGTHAAWPQVPPANFGSKHAVSTFFRWRFLICFQYIISIWTVHRVLIGWF